MKIGSITKLIAALLVGMFLGQITYAGVYSGSKEHPIPAVWMTIVKLKSDGKVEDYPEDQQISLKCQQVYYEGSVTMGSLVKPSMGEIALVELNGKPFALTKSDISDGMLKTEMFGPVPVYFLNSMMSEHAFLALTEEQVAQIKTKYGL